MRKEIAGILVVIILFLLPLSCKKSPSSSSDENKKAKVTIQLNWFHDPTFAGEYFLQTQNNQDIIIQEGGTNIQPVAEIISGRAHVAIVGADIFLKAIDKDIQAGRKSQLVCIFADFQRNPVGWILNPKAAEKIGFKYSDFVDNPKYQNVRLFELIKKGDLDIGDKRGTETTSIWIQWAKIHDPDSKISVLPVGFDPSVIISSPKLVYPVYLNEEPFKLSEKIGQPVFVFDPAYDGISIYGNVVVCSRKFAEENPKIVTKLQNDLKHSWEMVRDEPNKAVEIVSEVYKGASKDIIKKQIEKTVEFVFYESKVAGKMDLTPGGKWDRTLSALKASGFVSETITLEAISNCIIE